LLSTLVTPATRRAAADACRYCGKLGTVPVRFTCPPMFTTLISEESTRGSKPSSFSTAERTFLFLLTA
jgi:hypothetical protein